MFLNNLKWFYYLNKENLTLNFFKILKVQVYKEYFNCLNVFICFRNIIISSSIHYKISQVTFSNYEKMRNIKTSKFNVKSVTFFQDDTK